MVSGVDIVGWWSMWLVWVFRCGLVLPAWGFDFGVLDLVCGNGCVVLPLGFGFCSRIA